VNAYTQSGKKKPAYFTFNVYSTEHVAWADYTAPFGPMMNAYATEQRKIYPAYFKFIFEGLKKPPLLSLVHGCVQEKKTALLYIINLMDLEILASNECVPEKKPSLLCIQFRDWKSRLCGRKI
jgi:hypothetical protein